MYARVEPSGCTERYGLVQVCLSMCLEEGNFRYDDPSRFYVIDWNSKEALEGFKGKTITDPMTGQKVPVDAEEYLEWEASLPRVWLAERDFHDHFVYFDPYMMRDEDIEQAIILHLPNFYKAWTEGWDSVPGGMRHGWDVVCRKPRPKRYNKLEPENYPQRRLDSLSRVDVLKANLSAFGAQVAGEGETFPATEILVGSAAIDRDGYASIYSLTYVDGNLAANADGSVDTVEIFLYDGTGAQDGVAVWAGTFSASGNVLTCRDSQNMGSVTMGSKQTKTGLDVDVITGDYIGTYDKHGGTGTRLEATGSGFTRIWKFSGECIDASDSETFDAVDGGAISLYGTGETVVGWAHKINSVTSPGKVNSVPNANIGKINSVAA